MFKLNIKFINNIIKKVFFLINNLINKIHNIVMKFIIKNNYCETTNKEKTDKEKIEEDFKKTNNDLIKSFKEFTKKHKI